MGSIRFTNLKLAGFKSFVDPTDFPIETGLTGVVGPNGCGKSNLLEAIRWVMGANSAKAMRASGMDDVIFNGTQNRPARNFAEVSLTLDNSSRTAPTMFNDEDELVVTRRITKGSGSKYTVNGSTVRAKDVQLLFADASTGANSPSLVRQGQINELISAKPANRRRILEEAAGIAGLHTRRHEAELRLRAAETNLARLDDVIQQIEAQLLSLRRQARQATRYRKLAGEIRELEAFLWLMRWTQAQNTLETAKADLKARDVAVDETAKASSQLSQSVAAISQELPGARDEQVIAAAVYGRLNEARQSLEREEEAAKSDIRKLENRIQYMKDDISREETLVADADEALENLNAELEELAALEDIEGALKAAEAEAQSAEDKRAEKAAHLESLTGELASLTARKRAAEDNVRQLQQRKDRLSQHLDHVGERLDKALQGSGPDIKALEEALAQAEAALSKARDTIKAKGDAEEAARQIERESRDNLRELEGREKELGAEMRTLKNAIDRGIDNMDWVPVIESMNVQPGFERALTIALGDDLDGAVGGDAPLVWTGADVPDSQLPLEATSLLDLVKAPAALKARLSQIGLVEARDGDRLSKSLKPGQRLVSKDGDLWRWDGFRSQADAPSSAAIRLEQKNRLEALDGEARKLEGEISVLRDGWRLAQEAYEASKTAHREARQTLPGAEQTVKQAERALSQAQADLARREAESAGLKEQQASAQADLDDVVQSLREAEQMLSDAPDSAELDERVGDARRDLQSARETASELVATWRGLKQEAERRAARKTSVDRDIKAWQSRRDNASKQLQILSARLTESETALAQATSGPDIFAERRKKLLTELSEAETRRAKASDALAEIETRMKDAERASREAEQAHMAAREARAAADARVTASTERVEETLGRIREIIGCRPEELPQRAGEWNGRTDLSEADLDRKLEKLRRERENMGGVNLRADEEAEEQDERLSAMMDERQDLIAAIARLREGIDSLNEEGRERLLAAFETVNDHFRNLFRTLFGGGQAELTLTESDDPLEAGLEILVSPPGKKLGNMNLMSGGEQALTATALIFAVFLSNPAPICVLDEVDAPLDDANVDRYCNLLEEMRRLTDTRFMVITHNAVSMSRMDRLFGVTMAEKGVSQLVSVDLQAAERMTAAE